MKKLLLVSAVATLSMTSMATAHAAPTLYGRAALFANVDNATNSASTASNARNRVVLQSNGSRIGFRGTEKLSNDLSAIYQLEYGVVVNDSSVQFGARDSYLGLVHKQYGTLKAGYLSSIDGDVDYANVTVGNVSGGAGVSSTYDSPRLNNTIIYKSPKINDLNVLAMYAMDSGATSSLGRDAFGLGVQYEPAGQVYRAGASYIQSGSGKALRLSGAYDINPVLTVGALYQNAQNMSGWTRLLASDNTVLGNAAENVLTVSGQYKLPQTPWLTYAQLDLVDGVKGIANDKRQRLAVGGKYNFNANTIAHLYGAINTSKTGNASQSKTLGVGAGLQYSF